MAGESMNGNHPASTRTEALATLTTVHDSMIDGLSQLATYFGFGKVTGQIYGALLMSSSPQCLDDLVERLAISKANVSMNMRTLENMGMVRQVWVRGATGRRKYYEAETDFWQIVSNILKGREMRDIDRALSILEDSLSRLKTIHDSLDPEDQVMAKVYSDRIHQMKRLFEFAQIIILTIVARVAEGDLLALVNRDANA